ncbi:hypothetical protein MOJ79_17510 [Calidifontimicrobium sp. SYSU G02091]|uniref:hypothetical protein n=1 Tax=Calidifontimicrobium sp. SYSU G02091 TaxID=2926421 RepID=UPI001F538C4E|nr:hypothetical protein [Calidifontimicrobium sp. SYSU G02091]MCI1193633.1 hypothetical protein [Calidifontimicrobium sp. SYSU G02091]
MAFSVCDALAENPARFCAALAIAPTVDAESHLPQFTQPSEAHRSGTMTFVRSGGRSFGITCWHVVETLRNANKTGKHHLLRTMLNGFYVVHDRFVRPSPSFGSSSLDVAIREMHPDFAKALGKEEIPLDELPAVPDDVRFGYAVGFPESAKRRREEDRGYRVSMPQCCVLAEIHRQPDQRFTLHSQVPREAVAYEQFSGMSGGPIFWSDEHQFGIYGIVYEGGSVPSSEDTAEIYIFGELATPNTIRGWIKEVPALKF